MHFKTPFAAVLMAATLAVLLPVDSTPQARPMANTSPEAAIRDAMSAAPASIAGDATVMQWPEQEGGEPTQLRAGTNGWTCFASSPMAMASGGHDPMCADENSLEFLQAYMQHREPTSNGVGVAYMLLGDEGASNTDPWATEETDDNDWVVSGPHIMVMVDDPAKLDALPSDPSQGGPWVMWQGTAWAHIMVPVSDKGTPPGR